MNKPEFISLPDWKIINEKYKNNLEEVIKKLNEGYPVQYLIGNVGFYNTLINVNENVLIPRFETEGLVDYVINYAKANFKKTINIIDLGTGSGCIAIALKKNLDANVTALDISDDALKLAKENAKINQVKINFVNQSMLDNLKDTYDIIVSNPPYIPLDGYVEEKVKRYEPSIALFAEDSGIFFYKEILKKHLSNLKKPGLIAFEIGDNEQNILEEEMHLYPQLKFEFKNDLQGLARYLFIFNE